MTPPPISFTEKAKETAKGGGYPLQISASDLDQNFIYATIDIPEANSQGLPQPFLVSDIVGPSGKTQRQLTFNPPPPLDGKTYVLGFAGGRFQWLPTEEC